MKMVSNYLETREAMPKTMKFESPKPECIPAFDNELSQETPRIKPFSARLDQ